MLPVECRGNYQSASTGLFATRVTVLVASRCRAFPWLRWRFSLRTLLIATTLVAVVLGLIVWLETVEAANEIPQAANRVVGGVGHCLSCC